MSNQEATNKFVPSKHRNPSQTNSLPCSYCCNYGRCACTRSTSHLQVIVMRQLSLICLAVQQTIISGFKTERLGRAHFPQYGYPPLNTHLVCGIILPDRSRSNLAVDVFGIKYFEKTDIEHFMSVDCTGSTCLGQIIILHVFLFLRQQCILLMWRI